VIIPVGTLRKPVYREVFAANELADGEMKGVDLDGQSVLVARLGSEYVAVSNRCGATPLPLEFSRLDGAELQCSWHGCRYDLRTGSRLDAVGDRLAVFPVRVHDGTVQIAVAAEPVAREAH
jgi:3-phenylpropionate/trans-cinnamate dioxygenase ferredoxin subunit